MGKTLRTAIKINLPVLFGYLVLGAGFGLLLADAGFNFWWATLAAVIIYAGSGQYVMVNFLKSGLDLISCGITTLTVNSRHMFYGLSFLEKFSKMGWRKWYMIFSMTDETYSLLCSLKTPSDLDEHDLMFTIALLNHIYWIVGCTLGAAMGQLLPISTAGVEFSMTAVFLVIFLDQWKTYENHIPAFIGFGCAVLSFIIFGAGGFILPALAVSVGMLFLLEDKIRPDIIKEEESQCQ